MCLNFCDHFYLENHIIKKNFGNGFCVLLSKGTLVMGKPVLEGTKYVIKKDSAFKFEGHTLESFSLHATEITESFVDAKGFKVDLLPGLDSKYKKTVHLTNFNTNSNFFSCIAQL